MKQKSASLMTPTMRKALREKDFPNSRGAKTGGLLAKLHRMSYGKASPARQLAKRMVRPMETKKNFGAYICRCRKELGLTQREFADRLYVTESAVSKWERGGSLR